MADAWGGAWGTAWGDAWGAAGAAAAVAESTGGAWVDLDEAERRPKRQRSRDDREQEFLRELKQAYNRANGIVEEAPAEVTEAIREAVEGYSSTTEAQPLPAVDWQALAADMAAAEALQAALERLAYEQMLEEEAVEMLLLSA